MRKTILREGIERDFEARKFSILNDGTVIGRGEGIEFHENIMTKRAY